MKGTKVPKEDMTYMTDSPPIRNSLASAFGGHEIKVYPPGNQHISPWEKENHLQMQFFGDTSVPWRVNFIFPTK